MGFDRRVVVALSVIVLVLAPAAVLRAVCAGHSCDEPDKGAAEVPFCSLPDQRRASIVAGFREGRSPDIIAVKGAEPDDRVPLLFWGTGIEPSATIPPRTTLDSIAPTVAEIIDLDRPHPEVRSGTAIESIHSNEVPRLVIVVVLKDVGTSEIAGSDWPHLDELASQGAFAIDARVGSFPLDPVAVLTTVGTGGLPSQHGITGTLVRNDVGRMVDAWGPGAPVSVIAALGDDLDEQLKQQPLVGLIGEKTDRGLIGGNWYVDNDRDTIITAADPLEAAGSVQSALTDAFGKDETPDLLAVTLEGSPKKLDRAIVQIHELAARREATIVLTATGSSPRKDGGVDIASIERRIPGPTRLIEGVVPGGFFVGQSALAATGHTEDEVIDALLDSGSFADAFAAITVSFARYC